MFHFLLDDPTFVLYYPTSSYYVNETESITLRCRIKSFPKPTVWLNIPPGITVDSRFQFQTTVIEDSLEYSIVERSLTISLAKLSDYGNYSCAGNNTIANISINTALIVNCKFAFI